jgi:hypothetical protein
MTLATGVIYLYKDKLQLYSPHLGSILELRFSPTMIRDLDIIDSALVEQTIKMFVSNGKIVPLQIVFLLADNTYFIKDIVKNPTQSTENIQTTIDEFIEHVPFDNVVSKTVPLQNGDRVIATNKDFYESIAIAFEHQGFTVACVLPSIILGNGTSIRQLLDVALAQVAMQKAPSLKQYDLLHQQVFQSQLKHDPEELEEEERELIQQKTPDKKKIYTLVGVFATLIVLLVIVYVQSQTPPTPPRQPALADNTPKRQATPSQGANEIAIMTTPTPEAMSLGIGQAKTLSLQIVSASSSASDAQLLREKLASYSFKKITLLDKSSLGTTNTIVLFSNTINQSVKDSVLDEVSKMAKNISVQEKPADEYDITIIMH